MKNICKKLNSFALLRFAKHIHLPFARSHTRSLAAACVLLAGASPAQAAIQLWVTHPENPSSRHRHTSSAVTLASGEKRIFMFGGLKDHQSTNSVEAFDPTASPNGAWDSAATWTDMPVRLSHVSSAVAPDGKIYLIGGSTGPDQFSSVVYIFDPDGTTLGKRGSWTTGAVPPLAVARSEVAATFGPDGMLYIIGGKTSSGRSRIFERVRVDVDPPATQWDQLFDFPTDYLSRLGMVATSKGDLLVVGYKAPYCTSFAYEYRDIFGIGTWFEVTPMPGPGCLGGAGLVAAPDGFVYAVNDGDYFAYPSDTSVYRYNPNAPIPLQWSWTGLNTEVGGIEVGVAALDDRVYVTGGITKFPPPVGTPYPLYRIESLTTGVSFNTASIDQLNWAGTGISLLGSQAANPCIGQPLEVYVSVTGSTIFRWSASKDGDVIESGSFSALSDVLTILDSVSADDVGSYELRVWNDYNLTDPDRVSFQVSPREHVSIVSASLGGEVLNASTVVCLGDTLSWNVSLNNTELADWEIRKVDNSYIAGGSTTGSFLWPFGGNIVASSAGDYVLSVWTECDPNAPDSFPFTLVVTEPLAVHVSSLPPACEGGSVSIPVTVSGGRSPYTLQLKEGGNPIGARVLLESSSHNFVVNAAVSTSYTVEVTDRCGQEVTSLPNGLFVEHSVTSVAVTATDFPYLTRCEGTDLVLAVALEGTTNSEWQLSNAITGSVVDSGIESVSSFAVIIPDLIPGHTVYKLEVGNNCNNSPVEIIFDLTVQSPPEVLVSPALSRACENGEVTLTCTAVGSGTVTYQWYKNGDPLSGEDGNVLLLGELQPEDSAEYTVEVSDSSLDTCGPVVSTPGSIVQVMGPPTNVVASLGTFLSYVELVWDPSPFPGFHPFQRVYRYGNEDGLDPTPVGNWMSGTTMTLDDLTSTSPGHCYYYSVVSSMDGQSACSASEPVEGYRSIEPIAHVVASNNMPKASYILVGFNEAIGATNYQVLRSLGSNGVFSEAVRVHDEEWINVVDLPAQLVDCHSGGDLAFHDYSALPYTTYTYWVKAGPAASSDSAISEKSSEVGGFGVGSRTCENLAFLGLCTPDGGVLIGGAPAMVVVIDRSELMNLNGNCGESVLQAEEDIRDFALLHPNAKFAVWAFSDQCVSNLSGGFSSKEEALFSLERLPPCGGLAPLADALFFSLSKLRSCTSSTPTSLKVLALYTAGTNSSWVPGSSLSGLGNSSMGNECGAYSVPSWQWQICNEAGLMQNLQLNVHEWASGLPPTVSSGLIASLAMQTGGVYDPVPQNGSPMDFLPDCNNNGVDDDLDILNGTSLDCNANGAPDECEISNDCNGNLIPDSCDIAQGFSPDLNQNLIPDECEGLALTLQPSSIAGVPLSLELVGATPGANVALYASVPLPTIGTFPAGASATTGVAGLVQSIGSTLYCLEALKPWAIGTQPVFSIQTDSNGYLNVDVSVPSILAGTTILLQVVDLETCTVTAEQSVTVL